MPHLLRKTHRKNRTQVLVVGAGPAGLVAAITLASHGVDVLVIERRAGGSTLPRATHVSMRTMELLRSWGLEEAVRSGAVEVRPKGWVGRVLGDPEGVEFDIGYPSAEEAARWSPTGPAWAPQSHLEPVLLSHLAGLPGAELRRGCELVSLDEGDDDVAATVLDAATGRTERIRTDFVIGADGIRSTVRQLLGIDYPGQVDLGERDVALFRAPLARLIEGTPYALNGVQHPRPGTFIPFGSGDLWGFGCEPAPGEPRFAESSEREVAAVVAAAAGDPGLPVEIRYVGPVSFGAQTAQRFREGRAFITGDAAHRMTPRTGSGMNVAIHSAFDLAWKLAWVLRGWAPAPLLDTYEAERRPVAEAATARSVDPNGSERTPEEAIRAELGGRIPHVLVEGDRDSVSTVDLLASRGLTAFVRADAPIDPRTLCGGLGAPVTVRAVDSAAADALGIAAAEALVVRPDGRPTGAQAAGPATNASASPERPAISSLR